MLAAMAATGKDADGSEEVYQEPEPKGAIEYEKLLAGDPSKWPKGVRPMNREKYLSDDEFKKVFGMSKVSGNSPIVPQPAFDPLQMQLFTSFRPLEDERVFNNEDAYDDDDDDAMKRATALYRVNHAVMRLALIVLLVLLSSVGF